MAFYFFGSSQMAQPELGIFHQQSSDQVLQLLAQLNVFRKLNLLIKNPILCLSLTWVWLEKGRTAYSHFVQQHSQAVVIDLVWMPTSDDHFRTHILQTPAKRVPLFSWNLGKPEISYFDVSSKIKHNVFRFEIPIQNLFLVQILNS